MLSEALDSGRVMRHAEVVRARLARMRRDAQAALESAGIGFDGNSGEGIFLWGRVPDGTDVDALVRSAREKSILLANGALFSPDRVGNGRLRFNAAYSAAPELVRFLTRFGAFRRLNLAAPPDASRCGRLRGPCSNFSLPRPARS